MRDICGILVARMFIGYTRQRRSYVSDSSVDELVLFSVKVEDAKALIRSHKVQTIQWKRTKRQTVIYKTLHGRLKIEQQEPHKQNMR